MTARELRQSRSGDMSYSPGYKNGEVGIQIRAFDIWINRALEG